jgi:GT2 family glycosyltransferase
VQQRFPRAPLIRNQHNPGFAAANNQALSKLGFVEVPNINTTQPPYHPIANLQSPISNRPPFAVLLLNPDTIVRPGALSAMLDFMRATPQAGVAGAKLLNPDGTLQECAFAFPGLWQAALDLFPPRGALHRLSRSRLNGRYPRRLFEQARPFPIGHPLGAAFMARGEAILSVGLMDKAYHMYCEEIDWAWRMHRAGWPAYCVPGAEVVHYGGQSTAQFANESFVHLWRSRRRLYRLHRGRLTSALVGLLVRLSMRRRASKVPVSHREVYLEVDRLWR